MMIKKIYILAIISLLALCHTHSAKAEYLREYTKEKPLVIVADWEFPPYEYRNDVGEPDGYNVEVLDAILGKMKIPHIYVMKEWYLATQTFDNREADLIHVLKYKYDRPPYYYTHNMITYYNVRAVRLRSTRPLKRISQLSEGDTLTLKKNDYVDLKVSELRDKSFAVEYHSPREALMGIRSGKYKYYMWGEQPLKQKAKELGLDGIEFDETDMPSGELRIVGYDKDLIEAIDDMYARMEQDGDIQKIRDKWFHPERVHNDASPMALILLIAIVMAAIVILLFSHMMRVRVKKAVEQSLDINQMMTQALRSGNFYVIENDLKTNHIRNVYGDMLPKDGLSIEEFLARLPQKERNNYKDAMEMMAKGDKDLGSLRRRYNKGTDKKPDWRWIEGHAVVE